MANLSMASTLRVASWNVLSNWWYVYKYYDISVEIVKKSWPHRKTLTKQYIRRLNADILTLQEINPQTFAEDFSFMHELGYDGIMENSNNKWMRCGIFFRRDKITLVKAEHRAYKCLLAQFQVANVVSDGAAGLAEGLQAQPYVFVATCHLAANCPTSRVRQLEKALKFAEKMANASNIATSDMALIVCGDFNTFEDLANSPVRRFMLDGQIQTTFNTEYPVRMGTIGAS